MNEKVRKILLKFRFLLPAFMFLTTMFLIYLCVMHGFIGLFETGHYIILVILWGLFSLLLILWIAAFCILMFSDPGSIETEMKYFKCPESCKVRCVKCAGVKPLRTHHCSKCDHCYARMDHHCAALGRCIAMRNNKVFIVFLVYSILMLIIYAISCFLMIFFRESEEFPHILVADTFFGTSMAILLSVLLFEQVRHIVIGRTALELEFDIVVENDRNLQQRLIDVFGPPSVLWLLPTPLKYEDASPFMWEEYRITSKKEN